MEKAAWKPRVYAIYMVEDFTRLLLGNLILLSKY